MFFNLTSTVQKSEAYELLNQVDNFYNSAWQKLIIVGTVSFAVIGIIIPLIIQWYQKKTLKISENLLKAYIEGEVAKIKTDLLDSISQILDEKVKTFETKIENLNASMSAKAFHLQGNGQMNDGLYNNAFADFITSADFYLSCKEFNNLQVVLRFLDQNCLPKLSLEEIADIQITHGVDINLLLKKIEETEDNGFFKSIISSLKLKLTKLPKTKEEKN